MINSTSAKSRQKRAGSHCGRIPLPWNILIAMTVCLGSQCRAFQCTVHLDSRVNSRTTWQLNHPLVYSSTSSSYRRKHSLIAMGAPLVQDAADINRHTNEPTVRETSDQSTNNCKVKSLSTLLKILQPYASDNDKRKQHSKYNKQNGNKKVENQILRLGRKGNIEEALKLYFAINTLDQIRNIYRSKSMSLESKGKQVDEVLLLAEILNSQLGWEMSDNRQILELQKILETLKNIRPTTRLLNLAIDACARAHPVRQDMAFDLFHSFCVENKAMSPNVFTFGSLLASCARNGDVETSLQLLGDLENGKYSDVVPNGVIYSTVISACERKAGSYDRDERESSSKMVDLALELLNNAILALSTNIESGQHQEGGAGISVVGFNAAISTMARAAEWEMAVQLLDEMIMHSKSLSRLKDTESTINASYFNYTFAAPLLHVIEERKNTNMFFIPKPDQVTFGTVLAACERAGEWDELLRIAHASKVYGVPLDGIALTSVLHACQQLGLADEAIECLETMKQLTNDEKNGDNGNSNGLVDERRTNGRMRKGAKPALRGPDGVSYRLAISACARSPGRWRDGLKLLDDMRESALRNNNTANSPDVVAYTAAIAGCSEAGEYKHAIRLIRVMKEEGVQPNVVTFSAVIHACASASAQLSKRRDEGDRSIEIDDVKSPMFKALKLLDEMRAPTSLIKPNIFTYNAAIRACAEGMNLEGAFDLLRQLKDDGLKPTIVTFGSLMTACERVGNLDAASTIFRLVKEQSGNGEIRANEIIYGAAISCSRKAGQPERALLLLRKMLSENLAPNTATFNTVIAALSESKSQQFPSDKNNLMLEKALSVFKVMRSKYAPRGVKPNRITYNVLIKNLANNLQPGYAESLLYTMRNDGFTPDVDLYTLTVRSYERCGNPRKALSLMESMREVGYDFYENKVFDKAFKSGVKILNSVAGKGKPTALPFNEDIELDDDYDDREEIFDSWR